MSEQQEIAERPLAELAEQITAGAVRMAAATATWLDLVAEFDERGGWHGVGILSCAHWLSWQCGLGPGAAREHVRVARALRVLPRTRAAFAAGRLSFSKVRALTRVAEPGTEAVLLEFAHEATASQLERTVREWRRADENDRSTTERQLMQQEFRYWWDDDGMLVVRTKLPPEQGAAFLAAVESMAEREARRDRAQRKRAVSEAVDDEEGALRRDEAEERRCARERTAARRVAAMCRLADAAVDADRRTGDPPRREVVVHVDAAVLADDSAAGRCHVEGGPALRPAEVRRILCGATVVTMLERDREVLAMGRRKRRATKPQRQALLRRDGGCARPGCPETRIERLHAHHLRHWLFGGPTDLDNMVLLCDADHGLVHDHDLVMTRRDGRLVTTDPGGQRIWGTADVAFTDGLAGLDRVDDALTAANRFVGVHPIDDVVGRRPEVVIPPPDTAGPGPAAAPGSPNVGTGAPACTPGAPGQAGRRHRGAATRGSTRPAGGARPSSAPLVRQRGGAPHRSRPSRLVGRAGQLPTPQPTGAANTAADLGAALFPHGEPPGLPDAMHANGERLDLRWALGVLMGHRDFVRRMAAEARVTP